MRAPLRALSLAALLPLLALVACGDGGPGSSPDAGTYPWDSGIPRTDAGVDGGAQPGDGGVEPPPELVQRLRAIPGLTVQENPDGVSVPSGYRFFRLEYEQPADHARPEGTRFRQRATLLHLSDAAPMVLYTSGYYVSPNPGRHELTQLLNANQLSVEHRFFVPSRPEPADWSLLTIEQSATDFHRLVQALKPLYPRRWLATGISKGGEMVVFFRRFFPADVDGTVAYVAPLARRDDERFPPFQETVGGDAQAPCRARLHSFLREVLLRREAMLTRLKSHAADTRLTYTRLGFEKALEHAAIESYFAFWQYGVPAYCGNIPAASATDADLFASVNSLVGWDTFSDLGMDTYGPYYYQAALELGWPRPYESFLSDLLRFSGTDTGEDYAPPGVPVTFRPGAMSDIQDWVSTQGERLMFIYGELDPWTAAAYSLGGARDSALYTVPGGNHGARLSQLPEPQRAEALGLVRRWAELPAVKRRPAEPVRELEEFGPHVPPAHRRSRD
ncbi:S28 family serine protease [Myxococcaceae bacterium GXIMD 01537]